MNCSSQERRWLDTTQSWWAIVRSGRTVIGHWQLESVSICEWPEWSVGRLAVDVLHARNGAWSPNGRMVVIHYRRCKQWCVRHQTVGTFHSSTDNISSNTTLGLSWPRMVGPYSLARSMHDDHQQWREERTTRRLQQQQFGSWLYYCFGHTISNRLHLWHPPRHFTSLGKTLFQISPANAIIIFSSLPSWTRSAATIPCPTIAGPYEVAPVHSSCLLGDCAIYTAHLDPSVHDQ